MQIMRYSDFILLPLLTIVLQGCSSGGDSSGSKAPWSEEPKLGITIEQIPSATAPAIQPMSRDAAASLSMYLLRLSSWEAEVVGLNNAEGSRRFDFLTHPSAIFDVPNGDGACYNHGQRTVREAPEIGEGFQAISYNGCVGYLSTGEKAYFDGEVAFKYATEGDLQGILEVQYTNLHTQFGPEELEVYNNQRAEILNGHFRVQAEVDSVKVSANLTLQSNIDGLVVFHNFFIIKNRKGETTEATGKIGITGRGLFEVGVDEGSLTIGKQAENHVEINFDKDDGAFVEFFTTDNTVFGQYMSFFGIDHYDNRKMLAPQQRFPPVSLAKGLVNNQSLSITDDHFYLPGEEISIDLAKNYASYDESLIEFSLELEAIETYTRVWGTESTPKNGTTPIAELPEHMRPGILLRQNTAGRFALIADNVPGKRTALILRPVVRGNTGKFSESSTFKVFVIGDFDNDGTFDSTDEDTDNDGVSNADDDLPYDATSVTDTDGDGQGNESDPDQDNDGIANAADYAPLDPICHLPYSATEGVCFDTSYYLGHKFVGITKNGIALFQQNTFDPTIFRYDVVNQTFHPPIQLKETMTGWRVSTTSESDEVFLYSGSGEVFTAQNIAGDVELTQILNGSHSIDLVSSDAVVTGGNIYIQENTDSYSGLQKAHLYNRDGIELDAVEMDSSYIRLCRGAFFNSGLGCIAVEDSKLHRYESSDPVLFFPGIKNFSPDFSYFWGSSKIWNSSAEEVVDFGYAETIVGWTEGGLIVRDAQRVGVWDIEAAAFSVSSTYSLGNGFFVIVNESVYLVHSTGEKQLAAQRIEWPPM